MPPTLNSDLLELVIRELGEDRPRRRWPLSKEASQTLKACASASPILRSAAQHQLFKRVYILSLPRAKMLSEIIAANPGIARNVLDFAAHPGLSHHKDWMYTPSSLCLLSLLSLLPCIEHLLIVGTSFERFFSNGETRAMFLRALPPSIVRLACINCHFSGNNQLVDLIHNFQGSLHTLSVLSSNWPDSTDVETEEVIQRQTILPHTLSVRSLPGSSEATRPWFSVISPQNLTNLWITIYLPVDVQPWQAILDGAPKLRALDIHELVEHPSLLDLSTLTELRTLSANYTNPTRAFCRILATARRSSHLERAELALCYETEELFALVSWPQVKEAVESSAWADQRPNLIISLENNRVLVDGKLVTCVSEMEAAVEKHRIQGVTIK
jgi:hypothetical protein